MVLHGRRIPAIGGAATPTRINQRSEPTTSARAAAESISALRARLLHRCMLTTRAALRGSCEGARSKTRQSIMARSMWRGAIQFGLVTIPVKLYLATEQGGIGFNMLHKTCLNRIQMKIWCPYHEEVIPRSETV